MDRGASKIRAKPATPPPPRPACPLVCPPLVPWAAAGSTQPGRWAWAAPVLTNVEEDGGGGCLLVRMQQPSGPPPAPWATVLCPGSPWFSLALFGFPIPISCNKML